MIDYIKTENLKPGWLYEIRSNHMSFGVYNGKGGFIGLRTKFGREYLSTEYHYDYDTFLGTVFPIKEIWFLPYDIEISEDSYRLFEFLRSFLDGYTS